MVSKRSGPEYKRGMPVTDLSKASSADRPSIDEPLFNTAVSRMFGTRLPVVAGGLMWLSDANYVAAGANAGIMSFITAASFSDLDALRQEIRHCRELCEGRAFGVNVSMLPKLIEGDRTDEIFKLIVEEGVRFVETSGRNPEAYLPLLQGAGIRVLHKVPSVRFAMKAESVGVDMVSIVGAECGGHPGLDLVGSMVNQALAHQRLTIPFLIGGGIGTGGQLLGALANGAAGVVIGTRFLVADEIAAHKGYKQALVDAKESDTALTMSTVRNTIRTLKNETTETVARLEAEDPNINIEQLLPYVSGSIGRIAYKTGNVSKGMLSAGQSLGLSHQVEPLAGIVRQIELEAMQAVARLRELTPA